MQQTSSDSTLYSNEDLAAALVGFRLDDDNKPTPEQSSTESPTTQQPSQSSTWASNPLVQLAVVATGTGALFLTLSLVADNVSLPKTANNATLPTPTKVSGKKETNNNGAIKTGLAFGEQSSDIAALSEPKEAESKDSKPSNDATTTVSSTPTTRSTRPSTTPVRYTAPTPVAVRPRPPAPPVPYQGGAYSSPVQAPPTAPPPAPTTPTPAVQTSPVQTPPEVPEPPTAIAEDAPAVVEAIPPTLTVVTGTTVAAVVETPILVASDIPIKGHLRLTEPLTTASSDLVLPANTILIAEAVRSETGVYLQVSSALINGAEHPFTDSAVLALGSEGVLQNPLMDNAIAGDNTGIDIEQALVTGAIATLDLDRDDLLGGIALDVLGQLSKPAPERPELPPAEWTIPTGTELVIYINQPVTLPAPEPGPPSASSLLDTVIVRPEGSKTISFVQRGETVLKAWPSNPAMVELSYDQPLASGQTSLVHARLRKDSDAAAGTLNVITKTAAGEQRWHRVQLKRG